MKCLLVALAVIAAIGFAYAAVEDEPDDIDVIMSDVPLVKAARQTH